MAKKVWLDAGHGGTDPGAVHRAGRTEKTDTLRLTDRLYTLLTNSGIEVNRTRTSDTYVRYQDVPGLANAWGADLFVSFHRDGAGNVAAKGAHTCVYENTGTSATLAGLIKNAFNNVGFDIRYNGVSIRKDLYVLNATRMTAVLTECGFVTNDTDNSIFDSKFDSLCENLANAICIAVGVQYKGSPHAQPAPAPTPQPVAPKRYNVHLYEFNGGTNQQWMIVEDADGWAKMDCRTNCLCLDIDGGGKTNGTNVQIYQSNGSQAQRFKLQEVKRDKGSACVEIIPKNAPDMRVDCVGGGIGNKTNIQLHKANGTDAQRWYVRDLGGGYVAFINVNSGRVMDGGGKV